MLTEKLKQSHRSVARSLHHRLRIRKCSRIPPHLLHQRFNRFQHRIRSSREIIRMTFPARPQPRLACLFNIAKEPYILLLWFSRSTGRQTVNPRCQHAREKPSIVLGITCQKRRIHFRLRQPRDTLRRVRHSIRAIGFYSRQHHNYFTLRADRVAVVRIPPLQFLICAAPEQSFHSDWLGWTEIGCAMRTQARKRWKIESR